jgi:N-acetylglutamate synthase-like GNAT family acetyltransferase
VTPEIRVATADDLPEVRRLFREYAAWLQVDLCFQGFEEELAGLPGDYVAPGGVLLLAAVDGRIAGCVAAHRWEGDVCEMKRLFVRDEFRGSGSGRALVAAVLDWARDAGYRRVRLDTLPVMDRAQDLYRRLGFRDIEPYRANPVPGARFLELTL